MKNILVLFGLFCSLTVTSQVANWYGIDLSRIGYKQTKLTFENVPLAGNDDGNNIFSTTEISGGSFELSADVYGKHVYFHIDGSSFLDIGATLFQFNKSKQRWWNNDEYFVLRSDILPMRLAFGTNIGKYVSLYGGGQYSLSAVGLSYKESNPTFRDTRSGGNLYGFGGHVVGAYKFIHVRYSYMYNWINQARTFRGYSINQELVASLGIADVGVFLKFAHIYSQTNAGYLPNDRTELFFSEYEFAERSWQSSHHATQFQFSVGIYAAGLFSSVSNTGARMIGETEAGVARQRREERRRKIEWKE